MSSPLAIAAVTSTLRNLITRGLRDMPNQKVTTHPLDKARSPGASLDQINIFLYQTTPNAAWRNMDMPREVRPGESGHPPLALNLYYLITAYGKDDDDTLSHRWLGEAMSVLHDHPLLGAQEIKDALKTAELHTQIERVRITPQPLSLDEMSKLWTTFQTNYRVSSAYQVEVVLIESNRAVRTPLPVLTHGKDDRGVISQPDLVPQFPTIEELRLVDPVTNELLATKGRFSFEIGDRIAVLGHHFAGAEGDGTKVNVTIRLITSRLNKPQDIVVAPADRTDRRINFQIGPANIPAGLYELSTLVAPIGSTDEPPPTVEVPLLLAPKLVGLPGAVARTNVVDGLGDVTIAVTCSPDILPEQTVTLALGDVQLQAAPRAAATTALSFTGERIGAGSFRVRLRVDGVDSHIVDFTDPKKPQFIESQKVTIT